MKRLTQKKIDRLIHQAWQARTTGEVYHANIRHRIKSKSNYIGSFEVSLRNDELSLLLAEIMVGREVALAREKGEK